MIEPNQMHGKGRHKRPIVILAAMLFCAALPMCGLTLRSQARILDNRRLVIAVIQDHRSTAGLLLDRGLDSNLRFADLYRPSESDTIRWDWLRLTQPQLTRGAFKYGPNTPTLLIIAATNGDTDLVKDLVSRGADVNARGFRFHQAKDSPGHAGFSCDNEETTPLIEATKNGIIDTVALLLDHGADPHATSGFGQPPAYYVNHSDSARAAKILLMLSATRPGSNK